MPHEGEVALCHGDLRRAENARAELDVGVDHGQHPCPVHTDLGHNAHEVTLGADNAVVHGDIAVRAAVERECGGPVGVGMLQNFGGLKDEVAALLAQTHQLAQQRVFLAVKLRLTLALPQLGNLKAQRLVLLEKRGVVGVIALFVRRPGLHAVDSAAQRGGGDAEGVAQHGRGRAKIAQNAQHNGDHSGDGKDPQTVTLKKIFQEGVPLSEKVSFGQDRIIAVRGIALEKFDAEAREYAPETLNGQPHHVVKIAVDLLDKQRPKPLNTVSTRLVHRLARGNIGG